MEQKLCFMVAFPDHGQSEYLFIYFTFLGPQKIKAQLFEASKHKHGAGLAQWYIVGLRAG
jgi:hypothetical protein